MVAGVWGTGSCGTIRRMTPLPVIMPRRLAGLSAGAVAGDDSAGGGTRWISDLASAVEGEVRADWHNRMLYATDASLYQVVPLAVVIPRSVDDAVQAARFCARHAIPLLPRGGGTSLAGQCVNRAVVMDLSVHCRAVRAIDVAGQRAQVEAGLTIDELNDVLAGSALFFAPDPATSRQATIGGCIGNNAAGARSLIYGRTSENVTGIEAWIPALDAVVRLDEGAALRDERVRALTAAVARVVQAHAGLIQERFPKTPRRNAGYALDAVLAQMAQGDGVPDSEATLRAINLAHLLCGSEGTLGLILQAELRLRPVPGARGLGVIGLASLDEAIAAVPAVVASGPSAVELLDEVIIDVARANAEYSRYVDLIPPPRAGPLRAVLYVEYEGASEADVVGRLHALGPMVEALAPTAAMVTLTEAGAMAAAWKLRRAGEPLLHGLPGERKPVTFVEDNAVPVERLGEFVRGFREIMSRQGTCGSFWAHAGAGVLHVRPRLNLRDDEDRQRMLAIAVEVADLARSLGGVMSGEHGDGRARGPLLERFFGPELMGAFRAIKDIFDPAHVLNPGNIVAPGPLESIARSLRVRPDGVPTRVVPVETYHDFSDQHGLLGAAELCNGAGVCRKKSGGTMCPSYMATLDERHSTRGRGNALRLAISGQLAPHAPPGGTGIPAWDDPDTLATLDLCLACKACKAECPSNVDIARLKAEYLAQCYRVRGRVPFRARALAHVRRLNRVGSALAPVVNALGRTPPVRRLLDRVMGFDSRRTLPRFARSLTRQWLDVRGVEPDCPSGDAPVVLLFGDCFTMYHEPGIGLAARRLLEAFGYRVHLCNAGCCARPAISLGALDQALTAIADTLVRLEQAVASNNASAILVLEPSCLSAIHDDWRWLRVPVSVERRRALAERTFLVEDFLHRGWAQHPNRPAWRTADRPVLFHAHCHQKALWGPESSAGMLRRVVGDHLRVLDAGCCGMAGAFGYLAEHFDLSMRIAELALLPAVRTAPDALVLATGTSCRHQVRDGVHREPMHPVEYLAACLTDLPAGGVGH